MRLRRDAGAGDDGGRLALEQVDGELFIDAELPLHGENVALGLGEARQTRLELPDAGLQIDATSLHRAHLVGEVTDHVAAHVLGARVQSAHLIRSWLHIQQQCCALGFEFHQVPDLVGHPRVVKHEVRGGGELRASVGRREEDAQVVERLCLHIHFPKLTFQVDERVEELVLFAGEVEDLVLGSVVIDLPLQGVGQRVDLLQLLVDELLGLHVGGQTRFRRVIDVGRRQRIQEPLRPVREDVAAGHRDDARALHVGRLKGPTVLANPHGPGLHPNSEVLFGRCFETGRVAGDLLVEPHNQIDAALSHTLPKPRLQLCLVVLAVGGVQHDPAPLRVQHEEVNGASRHARRKPLRVGLDRDGAEPLHGHLFDATDKMVIHVVGDFVDGAAHQVVGTQDAKLVLDFVVVIAEVAGDTARRQHGLNARGALLIDKDLRRRLVHVHHLVCHQPPASVAHNGQPHEQPPVLAHQLDVRPQIFEADERCLRILCHLAAQS